MSNKWLYYYFAIFARTPGHGVDGDIIIIIRLITNWNETDNL